MIDAEYTINAVRKTVQKWPQSILIAAEWFVYGKDFPQTILLSLPREMDASGNAVVFTMIDVFSFGGWSNFDVLLSSGTWRDGLNSATQQPRVTENQC